MIEKVKGGFVMDLTVDRSPSFFRNNLKDDTPSFNLKCGLVTKKCAAVEIVFTRKGRLFEPVTVDNVEYSYHEIKELDGVVVGILGSQCYQLDNKGRVITDGCFEKDFKANTDLKDFQDTAYYAYRQEQKIERQKREKERMNFKNSLLHMG